MNPPPRYIESRTVKTPLCYIETRLPLAYCKALVRLSRERGVHVDVIVNEALRTYCDKMEAK